GRILDAEAERVMAHMRYASNGRYATGQCDGWKNISRDSLVASMINVEYTPWLLNLFNVSAIAKTAQNLFEIISTEITYCMEYLSTIIVAYCTDCAGDAKAMRDLLREKFPWIITLDCWAHQINLLVGDFFKGRRGYAQVMDQAEEIIKWFNNHSRALAMLRLEQQHQYSGRTVSLLYPVATRWSSRFMTCVRLLEIETAVRCLVMSKLDQLVQLTPKGKNVMETAQKQEKTRGLLLSALESSFWDTLKSLRKHLEPLAVATNITQSDRTRLDDVLLTLGKLYTIYSDASEFDRETSQLMVDKLETRWRKQGSNREVFILAMVFNPYVRKDCFNPQNPALTPGELLNMFCRVYRRMMQQEPNLELIVAFEEYLGRVGRWSDEALHLPKWKAQAELEQIDINLIDVWRLFSTDRTNGADGLVTFAMRVLSIVPNTAASERKFSQMGVVQNKQRSRLKTERVRKTVLLK
ncbi:hypothetical protein OH77DRAFT_1379925, partial [Trametes cingulata]